MKQRRFVSIFRKQLLVACVFALLLATGTSIYQFFSDIEQLQNQADATLMQILMATAGPLEELLVVDNLDGATEHLEGLFSFAPILSITLLNDQQNELVNLRRQPAPPAPAWWELQLFGPIHQLLFSLTVEDGTEASWFIQLDVSNARIQTNIATNLAAILLTNFIVCFFLTLAFHGLLHALFTRQIIALTTQLNNFKGTVDKNLELKISNFHQNDEMGILAKSINSLWKSRQELQKNLANHNQFVTTVTAISPVGLFRTDSKGELIWYNQKARVLLGILGYEKSLDEWLGNLHPAHHNDVMQAWQDAISKVTPFHAEFPLCLADNQTRWVIGEAIPSWSSGHFEGYVGTLTDVTQLKQATAKLHESEERYHAITQSAISAIVLTEVNGTVSYWNPAAERIFGFTRKQALGKSLADLIIPEKSRHIFAEAYPNFDEQAEDHSGQLIEFDTCTKDGGNVPVEMSLSAFHMEGIWHAAMIISDISKRITSEQEKVNLLDQLRQSQKMEAIGTLAGGIAHDFNNILTPILGFGQLLQIKFDEGSKERDRVDKILSSANRAKDLVGQILSFSRKSKEEAQPIMVVPVVQESLKLLRAGTPSTIDIITRISSTDFWILADPTRIHQILLNLSTNAVQAMSDKGGTLTIAIDQFCPASQDYPKLPAGNYLRLQVIDTGTGIDQYTKERIFDPYFTTKGSDTGTGLGLAVVQNNTRALGGLIEVDSEVGKGSTFTVLLPLITGDFQPSIAPRIALPHGGGQHLLLVDDELSLVNIGREFLQDLGYQVTATTNSREAMDMIEKDPDRFDMLITDQTMPQLTGLELARKAKQLRPDLPIVICTGQHGLIDEAELAQVDIIKVLGKPDIFDDLAGILNETFSDNKTAEENDKDQSIWS